MIFLSMGFWDDLGEKIVKAAIPHPINNHRPVALQSRGLLLFLGILLASQILTNFFTGGSKVLGYATNISAPEIIRLTNEERVKAGLSSLTETTSLDKGAGLKAQDMFAKDYWAHFAPDGTSPWYFFGLVGYNYTTAGENLARDFSTSTGVVAAWMVSPGHKANILNSNFTDIGVAVVDGKLQGEETTLVVQFFGHLASVAAASVQSPPSKAATKTPNPKPTNLKTDVVTPAQNNSNNSLSSVGQPTSKSVPNQNGVSPISSLFANVGSSQKVTVFLLMFMVVLLVLDSFILFRKRHVRFGSHSFAHASVLLLLIAVTLLYGKGTVL
jgi:uncharacterized protein YkwD